MTDSGRSTLRINGQASTAGYVRDIRDAIAEIVGQHEAQRLLSAAYHSSCSIDLPVEPHCACAIVARPPTRERKSWPRR